MKHVDVLGLRYAATDYQEAADFIHERALNRQSAAIFALPVHGVVTAHQDIEFKSAADIADLIVPDGQPIKWYMNWVHQTALKDRVYGPELVRHVLERANQDRLSVFLYGGATQDILDGFSGWIREEYSDVTIAGTFREPSMGTTQLSARDLQMTGAHIVLCGLGCPAQEKWIANNRDKVDAVMMGVGAAFSFHSGYLKVAPSWMQRNGLEWLYRLYREPRRLWKRYFFTNTKFLLLVLQRIIRVRAR